MSRKILLYLLVFSFLPISLSADLYLGLGGSYLMPQADFKDYNQSSWGGKLELMNKNYCKLWYGLRLDYLSLASEKDKYPKFDHIAMISPVVKYAPFVTDCYNNKLIPFAEAMLDISSISGDDELSKLGLGAGLGLGLAYNFKLFGRCMMLEADAIYSAPNTIYRADGRENLKSINVGLTLSVGL